MIVFITNSIPPYGFDLQQILGLPSGLCHRFRYTNEWIHTFVKSKLFEKQKIVIVLRDWETGKFIPVREATLMRSEVSDGANIYHFFLQDYISELDSILLVDKINEWLKQNGFSNVPKMDLNPLVFNVDLPEFQPSENEKSWVRTVKKFSDIALFKEYSFFKIKIKDQKGIIVDTADLSETSRCLKVSAGATYEVCVEQYSPNSSKEAGKIENPFDVKFVGPNGLDIIRGEQRVVGKYDTLRFVFRVPEDLGDKFIECSINAEQEGEAKKYGMSRISLPMEISYSLMSLLFSLIGFVLFICIGPVSPSDTTGKIMVALLQALAVLFMIRGGGTNIFKFFKV